MNFKILATLLLGIVVGGAIGFTISYSIYSPQISTLQIKLNYSELKNENLTNEKNVLQQDNNVLQNKYDSLQSTNTQIKSENTQNIGYLKQLSNDLIELKNMLRSKIDVTESFSRTLNDAEVKKTSSVVSTLATKSTNDWTARDNIYEYITSNIKYCYDTEYPYISNWRYVTLEGSQVWTEFNVGTTDNYIQTPEFTLANKQGDCDDQAFLEYAMIMYFYRYISGTTYTTYIACIDFASGPGHLAVFIPVTGGRLCILDTAGHYRTSSGGSTTSKIASTELGAYNSYWESEDHPSVTKITLYSVDTTNGTYSKVSEGSLSTIANFLSK